jgi:hypothetical protein
VLPFLALGKRGVRAAAWLSGAVFLFGLLPLFVHQSTLTGHFYLPTYNLNAVTPEPSGAVFVKNLSYYLGKGAGAGHNWFLATLLISIPGALALGAFPRRRELALLGLGALASFGLPLAYFLLYQVQEPYYLAAGTLTAGVFFAVGTLFLEEPRSLRPAQALWIWLAAWPMLSVAPGALREAKFPESGEAPPVKLAIPDELRDPRGWVWAEYYSGTLTYFGGHAAFKLPFSTPESRRLAFAFARGSPQYLLEDSSSMTELAAELRASGARLERAGRVEPFSYYRIDWPTPPVVSARVAPASEERRAARD